MADTINRQAAIDKIKKRLFETAFNNVGIKQNIDKTLVDVAENRLENWFNELPPIQPDTTTHDSIPAKTGENDDDRTSGDCISRRTAIDAICEDGTWLERQGCVDITMAERKQRDVDIISNLPSVQPTLHGYNIEHLELIARVLQKEDLSPERVVEALTDIGRIVEIIKDEIEETLRRAVDQCVT